VEALPAAPAADLVRAIAGPELSAERVDDILSRCGGVPLLLEEVTRSMLETPAAGTAARATPPPGSTVPPELQLVVESRLERWPRLKAIIEAASVLGRDFPISLLEAVLPAQRADLPGALSLFADQGLMARPGSSGSGRASFRHALIRDAVYETLVSKEYLTRLHSRAADTLIAQYLGTPDASPDTLAQHLRLAERVREAIGVRLAAAEETFTRGAYVESNGHCEATRELIDEVRDTASMRSDAFRLRVLIGMVATGSHGYSADPAEVAYREAQSMFDDRTGPDLRYPVVRGLATAALVRGDLATAYRFSLEGLELAERSHRPDYRIDAMSVLCYTTLYFGRLDDCRAWIDRCLSLYGAEGGEAFRYPVPQDAKTAALALLPTVAWLLGDPQGANDAVTRGLTHVENLGRDFDRALMHAWVAGTRYTQRRDAEALRHAGIAFALGSEHTFQEWQGVGAKMALLRRSALQPDPDAGAQAMALGQQLSAKGIGLNASYFLWGIARGLIKTGNVEQARGVLATARGAAAASQETRMNPEIWILEAEIEIETSRAIHLLMDAHDLANTQGAVANALRAAAALVARAGHPTDVQWARDMLDTLDGRTTPDPDEPRWMHEALAHAQALLAALRPAAHGM
jgi:hypothetical protein